MTAPTPVAATPQKEMNVKTVYVLRVRMSDEESWGEPGYYRTRRARDKDAAMNRAFGGIRTHSYEEKKTPEEIDELCD